MNKTVSVKCSMFRYVCGCCGNTYKAPVYLGEYGSFLLNNYGSSSKAWLDGTSSQAFKEAGDIVRKNANISQFKKIKQSSIFQKIVGYVYDPDDAGEYYGIDANPECPSCKSHDVAAYEEITPLELVAVDVCEIKAQQWSVLSLKEKESLIDSRLRRMGY